MVHGGDIPLRSWQWKLREAGVGPDHAAWLRFEEDSPGTLEAAVRGARLPGFLPHRHRDASGEAVLTYIDEFHSRDFAKNLSGRDSTNLWTYVSLRVHGSALMLENGYGSGSESELAVQTRLLHRLASRERGLRLVHWRIGSSDTGIALKVLAEGSTGAELEDYLRSAP